MAIWKDQPVPKSLAAPVADLPKRDPEPRVDLPPSYAAAKPVEGTKESVIASGITIEGKIEGSGHIRIAGKFQGDVHVKGNVTIETGAKVIGGVRAAAVVIAGELEGNVDEASRVELLDTGVLNGNLKAGSLTVAAGSKMRGQVEFGWGEVRAGS
ncbi:MAG: polymer-forming cytoskeletal protein [Gemmatimonadetes bacterium]|nr:polymer-forming cytoskeletal protein [Gemmatimonadota bacterium]